jgi:small-conductance mechanosensitive channel
MEKLAEVFAKHTSNIINIIIGIGVFIGFILVSWLLKKIILKQVKPRTQNPLLAEFLGKMGALTISIIGLVVFFEIIGLGGFASHILAGAGITTFVIGFAFKDIGENFLAGILMAFKSPFRIGDLIETNNTIGYVTELNLRETIVKTRDGKDVYIPNSQIIKTPLNNYTIDGFLRYDLTIGLDYNSDFNKAIDIIKRTLAEMPDVIQKDKKPFVVIEDFLASCVNIKVYYWIDTFKSKSNAYHLIIKTQISIKIMEELNKANFYMPADIIELKNYASNAVTIKKS